MSQYKLLLESLKRITIEIQKKKNNQLKPKDFYKNKNNQLKPKDFLQK